MHRPKNSNFNKWFIKYIYIYIYILQTKKSKANKQQFNFLFYPNCFFDNELN